MTFVTGGRAAHAADPAASRGRRHPQAPSASRTEFQRDRDRIVHSTAFRRLTYKTQVFIASEGDHYRTRLTHSLEVAQVARSLARVLGLDEDLTEAVALAHDFGHTPFGHAGESVLDTLMADRGGFDHNAQSYRIVTHLERRYAAHDGLNLTFETLEGLVKHNGPLTDRAGMPLSGAPLPHAFAADPDFLSLEPWTQPALEAQCAAIADDIAYNAHDIDDGLRAGLIDFSTLAEIDYLAAVLGDLGTRYGALEPQRRTHELVRHVITDLIEDVIRETARRIAVAGLASIEDVRAAPGPLVAFSDRMRPTVEAIRTLLFARLYRHPRVLRVHDLAAEVVADLFGAFTATPEALPARWRLNLRFGDDRHIYRRACDYISGMTDRFALSEHARLFAHTPDLDERAVRAPQPPGP